MLDPDPKQRPTIADVIAELEGICCAAGPFLSVCFCLSGQKVVTETSIGRQVARAVHGEMAPVKEQMSNMERMMVHILEEQEKLSKCGLEIRNGVLELKQDQGNMKDAVMKAIQGLATDGFPSVCLVLEDELEAAKGPFGFLKR